MHSCWIRARGGSVGSLLHGIDVCEMFGTEIIDSSLANIAPLLKTPPVFKVQRFLMVIWIPTSRKNATVSPFSFSEIRSPSLEKMCSKHWYKCTFIYQSSTISMHREKHQKKINKYYCEKKFVCFLQFFLCQIFQIVFPNIVSKQIFDK